TERAIIIRYQNAQLKRIKKEREKYKSQLKQAQRELEEERKKNDSPVSTKETLIFISLRLFLVGHIGFRGISRVLEILQNYLGITRVPCAQTIINWVTRYSLSKIWNYSGIPSICLDGSRFANGGIWIMDTSIALGSGKILTVLELKLNHFQSNKMAPTLEDINCVAVSVAKSWTGEGIASFLEQVIHITGKPAAYLKDGGRDLMKAVRLLNERGFSSLSIDDVSHVVANLLRNEYTKHPLYDTFISACGQASKNLKQTILAFFTPPKVSTKARFMNIHRLVKWAQTVLKHSPAGAVSKNSPIAKLRKALGKLPECKSFINRFLRDAIPLLKNQEIIKSNGLNLETYQQCKELIEMIPQRSPVRIGFTVWMEKQLIVSASLGLGNIGMPVSSDNIESLFALGKTHGTGDIKDADRIALRLPAFCGKLTEDAGKMVMSITVNKQLEIEKQLLSLTRQRREILPNPGSLTDSLLIESNSSLSLIPVPKSDQNSENIIDITGFYDQDVGFHNKVIKVPDIPNSIIDCGYATAS
ncbi:MAG: hypothetical protein HQK65_22380, partial [Desulfamplus sp.]|nr:hypothetical protein [Desulfamplus sp.]